MKRTRLQTVAVATFIAASFACLFAFRGTPPEHANLDRFRVKLLRVEPDLTLRCDVGGKETAYRLSGIRTGPAANTDAANFLARFKGDELLATFDAPVAVDADGVVLCYAYTAAGELLNEALIKAGLARVDRSREYALRPWFEQLDSRADRRRSRGGADEVIHGDRSDGQPGVER